MALRCTTHNPLSAKRGKNADRHAGNGQCAGRGPRTRADQSIGHFRHGMYLRTQIA